MIKSCFFPVQVTFQDVYGSSPSPLVCSKKLPRLVNGIPLGAGRLSASQTEGIRWRYVEGSGEVHTFLSSPISWEEADETRQKFRNRLVKHAKALFGDTTVKTSLMLSHCLNFETDLYINDIAETLEEGLYFHD